MLHIGRYILEFGYSDIDILVKYHPVLFDTANIWPYHRHRDPNLYPITCVFCQWIKSSCFGLVWFENTTPMPLSFAALCSSLMGAKLTNIFVLHSWFLGKIDKCSRGHVMVPYAERAKPATLRWLKISGPPLLLNVGKWKHLENDVLHEKYRLRVKYKQMVWWVIGVEVRLWCW